ncbi:GGDEF domain-containing protein [Marinomonas transparens]|uniref:diguanylate cyclase n=1 Tax=Marinomonas transparens TaxID=2795388 RepID=A0A934JQA7_9GAMM|nr:GGDEF domain-containing protein [Marinomonas transparens]MBJ7538723.1 GGDEF domain-containing protein [Marinomonas transparens]
MTNSSQAQPNQTATRLKKSYWGLSLGKQFALLLLIVILLFVTVGFVLQNRLEQTQSILQDLTLTSLPAMVKANQTAVMSNELLASLKRFSSAMTPPEMRIAKFEIEKKLNKIQEKINKTKSSQTQIHQWALIQKEVTELTHLIEEKFTLAAHIKKKLDKLWALQASAKQLNELKQNLTHTDVILQTQWQLTFLQTTTLAYVTANIRQLSELQEIRLTTQQSLDKLESIIGKLPSDLQSQIPPLNASLENTLIGPQGLIEQQAQYLRIVGRSRGREYFIHNMINDYSNIAGRISLNENDTLNEKAAALTNDMKAQKEWFIGAFFLLAAMISAILAIYIHMIKRLKLLTQKIHTMTENQPKHEANENEIDELFEAFDQFSETINSQTASLKTLSLTDSLTNISNRRAFDQQLQLEITSNQALSILLIDVDFFKQYNDTYGHLCGDEALQKIALILSGSAPDPTTLIARYGGEEFTILLPNTTKQKAQAIALKIMNNMQVENIEHSSSEVSDMLTVSIGIVTRQQSTITNSDTLMKQADIALYHSKEQGRAQITHIDDIKKP